MLLAFVSVALQARDAARMPDQAALAEAAAFIEADWRDGDAVRPLPDWFGDARVALGDRPYLMATPLDELEQPSFERVWFIASGGAPLRPADLAWTGPAERVFEGDQVEVYVATVRRDTDAVWDGLDRLEDASVRRGDRACTTWTDGGWHCGRYHEFLFVGAAQREMDEQPRSCISANAPEGGEAWSVRWDGVPTGDELVVRAGNTFDAVRALRGSHVELVALINGDPTLTRSFDPNEIGYPALRVSPLPAEPFELEIRVRADDHLDRFFCFRPQVRAASAPRPGAPTN